VLTLLIDSIGKLGLLELGMLLLGDVVDHLSSKVTVSRLESYISYLLVVTFLIVFILRRGYTFKIYNKDFFYGVLWTWQYSREYNGTSVYVYDQCFCSTCGMELDVSRYKPLKNASDGSKVPNRTNGPFCERCGKTYVTDKRTHADTRRAIKREIERRLRTGEWKKYLLRRLFISNRTEDRIKGELTLPAK